MLTYGVITFFFLANIDDNVFSCSDPFNTVKGTLHLKIHVTEAPPGRKAAVKPVQKFKGVSIQYMFSTELMLLSPQVC